jgi:hypothetical protein
VLLARWQVTTYPDDDVDDLTQVVDAWPQVEQAMVNRAAGRKDSFQGGESELLVDAVRRAARVEVQNDHGLRYVLVFDGESDDGPDAGKYVRAKLAKLEQLVKRHAPARIPRRPTEVAIVPPDQAVAGSLCRRLMTSAPETPWPDPGTPSDWEGP